MEHLVQEQVQSKPSIHGVMVSRGEPGVRAGTPGGPCISEGDKAGWLAKNMSASAPGRSTVAGTARPLGAAGGIAHH